MERGSEEQMRRGGEVLRLFDEDTPAREMIEPLRRRLADQAKDAFGDRANMPPDLAAEATAQFESRLQTQTGVLTFLERLESLDSDTRFGPI